MRRGIAFRIVSLTLAAAIVLACAEFRAAPAAARSLTAAEEAALAEIKSYLANYYGNSGDPRINEMVNYAREQMLAIDDANNWNAGDGNRDNTVIPPRPPEDEPDDEDYIGPAIKEMLEQFRKEELARQKNHYRNTITPTPKNHWSYEEDDEGNEKNPDAPGRITPYEQELIDRIVADKVKEQRKNLEEEFSGAGEPGKYIDDAPDPPQNDDSDKWKETIDDILNKIGDITPGDIIPGDTDAAVDKIIDQIVGKITDKIGDIPAVGSAVAILFEVMVDRLVKYYTIEEEYPGGFFTVEFPALLGAGVGLIVASAVVYAIAQAADSVGPAIFDAVALGVALAMDGAISGTRASTKTKLVKWKEDIEDNYKTDHAAFGEFAYASSLPGVMSGQSRLSVPGGASFVMDAGRRASAFNSLHPGYRTSPGGIYMEDYKKIAGNWRDYAVSQREVSLSEAAGLAAAWNAADAIKLRSRAASGYSRGLQAHNEARLLALQQTLKLRMDMARQTDFRSRAALDRQQKREDLHAAFGRASRGWTLSAGASY
ncbi:MAG: hypothetical protein LBS35_05520 [Synergistaceae bacterium]|nr:hypothetical protein [Synergistaceae bacterium]